MIVIESGRKEERFIVNMDVNSCTIICSQSSGFPQSDRTFDQLSSVGNGILFIAALMKIVTDKGRQMDDISTAFPVESEINNS